MPYDVRPCYGTWAPTDEQCAICDIQNECRAEKNRMSAPSRTWQYTQNAQGQRVHPTTQTTRPVIQPARSYGSRRDVPLRDGESPWWAVLWDTIYAMVGAGLQEMSCFFQTAPRPAPPPPKGLPPRSVDQLPGPKEE